MRIEELLNKSKPFIYSIDKKYYLISSFICQEYTGEDAAFAEKFIEEMNRLLLLHANMTLNRSDIEIYNKLYAEIEDRENRLKKTQTPAQAKREIKKLLCLYKDNVEEIANLSAQYENMGKLSWLQTEIAGSGSAEKEIKAGTKR